MLRPETSGSDIEMNNLSAVKSQLGFHHQSEVELEDPNFKNLMNIIPLNTY